MIYIQQVKRISIIGVIISFILVFSSLSSPLFSQDKGNLMEMRIENGDTIYLDQLPPAYINPKPPRGKAGKKWRDYYKTVYNFQKTYPYALIAKDKIVEVETKLAQNNLSNKQKEKYIKDFEKELFNEFEKPLRNLTFTQGRMLLRLIDRELGLTSFYIIKNYRGGVTAGFWQGVAKLFGADLKKPYDKFGEDKELEELIEIYEQGYFPYLYTSIFGKYPEPTVSSPSQK